MHPEVADRSCQECQTYLYNDQPGRMGLPVLRGPNRDKVKRIKGQSPACRWCPKIPKGEPAVPSSAVHLSERNAAAYLHYRRCRAVLRFPADRIVERNAALIQGIEEQAAERRLFDANSDGMMEAMLSLRK